MPKILFSKRKIDSLEFTTQKGQQIIYWDTGTSGLGLVVGARTKTFVFQCDVKDATKKSGYRTVKKTLGRYGVELTLEQAKAAVAGYIDKGTGQAVQGERLKLKASGGAPTGDDMTLAELVESYFAVTRRKRDSKERRTESVNKYKKSISNHYGGWLPLTLKQINEITPDMVTQKYQQIAIDAGPYAARNSSVMLSAILRYGCYTYPVLQSNPLAVLTAGYVSVMHKIEPRHDCLIFDSEKKRNDFKIFYDAVQQATEIQRDMYLLTLYTGMRRGEVESLKWEHVDLQHAEIMVPDTKNRHPLHIPVNRQSMEILKRRRGAVGASSPWVFAPETPSFNNKLGHSTMRPGTLQKCTGLKMTIHGLRRTFTTIGRKLKLFEDTSRLTNHVDSSVEGKHYDKTGVADLRESSQLIADTIERYMKESGAVVIQFPGSAQAA